MTRQTAQPKKSALKTYRVKQFDGVQRTAHFVAADSFSFERGDAVFYQEREIVAAFQGVQSITVVVDPAEVEA